MIIGANPSPFDDLAFAPSPERASKSPCMGLLLVLASPVSTVYPRSGSENAEVMNLRVVPELSAFTTSSGAEGSEPRILRDGPSSSILAPMALQAWMVARVSLEIRGLETLLFPRDRLAIKTALCV